MIAILTIITNDITTFKSFCKYSKIIADILVWVYQWLDQYLYHGLSIRNGSRNILCAFYIFFAHLNFMRFPSHISWNLIADFTFYFVSIFFVCNLIVFVICSPPFESVQLIWSFILNWLSSSYLILQLMNFTTQWIHPPSKKKS